MSVDFTNIEDGKINELLSKAKAESLRYYNEVEQARLAEKETGENKCDVSYSQIGGKRGSILYDGADATGFHLDAGKTYIYPTNYPVRQYQATMVKTALFKNTMVSLPTGLGKTFIAAVVMYNFYRWYPNGKVVFMAPTRPLVAQQTKACHNIMNIPTDHTAELTGMQNAELREKLWKEKRVFYLTPQVMVNDLKSKTCPASLIKCIVIDEAHRATKDYAYCQVLKLLSDEPNTLFRVLGLSATPGNDINAVQQVVRNLGISALEMRSEDSLDVAPYTHSRSVDTIVVELSGNILRVKDDLLQVFEKYAKRLKDFKALPNNIATVSKFQILKACEKFRANPPRGVPPSVVGNLISDFTVCMSLAHSLELLQTYGLRAFYTYLADDNSEKTKAAATRLRNDDVLKEMLKRLHLCLFPKLNNESTYIWSHPKLKNLVTSLTEHFKNFQSNGGSTKAIVFCQYRVVVSEIVELLSKYKPLIKATEFIGQSGGKEKGMPQAKQLQIMKDFRSGIINCLVATCVAEEGLDIGEVDLIILMEAHKSPVRLVQRIGRTGRKRKGCCLVLLTKGREEQKFHEAMATRKSYVENIMKSSAVKTSLCQESPRMIPIQFTPVQQFVHINVTDIASPARPQIKKQADIRKCFTAADSPFLSNEELQKVVEEIGQSRLTFNGLPKREEMWHRRFDKKIGIDELLSKSISQVSEWNEWNHDEQETYHIDHTPNSRLLCHLLKMASKEITLPDWETNMKLDDIVSESSPKRSRDKGTEKFTSPNKRKRMKKDPVKKNHGMDIRNCMGLAKEKSSVQKQVIEIISDEENDIVENISEQISPYKSNVSLLKIEQKRDAITSIYMDDSNTFRSFNKFIPSFNVSKTWTYERNLPKLETFFENITFEIIKSISFPGSVIKKEMEPKISTLSPKIISPNDIVEVDDLFDTESDHDDNLMCLNTAISEFHETEDIFSTENVPTQLKTEHPNLKEKDVEEEVMLFNSIDSKIFNQSCRMGTTFNETNDIFSSINTPFFESKAVKQSSENKTKELENKFHHLKKDLLVTESNVSLSNSITSGIIASTPNPSVKNFKKNQVITKISSEPKIIENIPEERVSPFSDASDMWNLSDLFEEEEMRNNLQKRSKSENENNIGNMHDGNSIYNESDVHNSTMLGITQLVSLIEKDKGLQRSSDGEININNNLESNLNSQQQKDHILFDYLECDDDLFTQVNDQPAALKHSSSITSNAVQKSSTQINNLSSQKIEFSKSLHQKTCAETEKLSDVGSKTNITNRTQMSNSQPIVNLKKMSIFSKDQNSQSVFSENILDSGTINKLHVETFSEKSSTSMKVKNEEPVKFRTLSETWNTPNRNRIFTQVKDEPIALKHPSVIAKDSILKPVEKSSTQINNPSPQKIEFGKSLHHNEIKFGAEKEKLSNVDNQTNFSSSTQMSQSRPVVNFKKFSSKKLLFSKDKNSQSACSENILDRGTVNELHFETFSEKPSTSKKVKNEEPVTFRTLSETWNTPNLLRNNVKSDKPLFSVAKKKLLWDDKIIEEAEGPKTVSDKRIANINQLPEKPKLNEVKFSELKKGVESKPKFISLNKPIWNFSDSDDSDIFMPLSPKENKRNFEVKKNEPRKEESCSMIKRKKRKKVSNEFIEKEADVEGTIISSDDSDGSSLDDVDNSFINDDSEYISNHTQAIYLQSVKSPINKGNFKIPTNKVYCGNVYSQQVEADSEYINDSFCVDSEEDEKEDSASSLSFLEIAEKKLENRKNGVPKKKRRRILKVPEDDYTQPTTITMSEPSPIRPLPKRKRRRIQSESEAEESPIRKKKSVSEVKRSVDPELVFSQKYEQNSASHKQCPKIVKLSSDEEDCIFVPTNEKVVDLTSDIDEEDSDSEFEKKFKEDLNEAIRRSQSDFIPSQRSHSSSKISTPKTDKKKVLDMKKLDRSLRGLNEHFCERLSKIKNKFCSSDESFNS
ncbi:DEAD-box ATP-dependent DNA helicase Fancm [Halyomorpha halys]|uniref:DEAD-box ATP-dependent DNA helicase Fancm n=1 Tax=Halyomorpha halys TaxID=286706 RepID=UPI0006D4DC76|nr:Fanconi anemia group M protein [Halyomorpha halys]